MRLGPLAMVGMLVGALLALASLGGRGSGQAPVSDEEARNAIRAVLIRQQTDWNRGDVTAFLDGYWKSPELTFSGDGGITRGWQGVLERYRKAYPNQQVMGRLTFSDLEFRPLGDSAELILGKWELKRTSGDVGGVFSLVWQRFPEGWRIVHDHTSVVAKPQK